MSDSINFLGHIPLGKIQIWDDPKMAGIIPIAFPGEDAGATEAYDTLGIIAYIKINGRFTGSFREIQSYISSLKAIADGKQTSSQKLRSPFVNSIYYDENSDTHRRQGDMGINTNTDPFKLIDTSNYFKLMGITNQDKVKNLLTGEVSNINNVLSNTHIELTDDIFPEPNTPFAVTAWINTKIIDFEPRWQLPGLSYCDYSLTLIQVR